jgi:3-oxoacyl-[acyl-carrier protein] reductase
LRLGLEDKVALIAGGSSGLGLAIAKQLVAEGAHVAIGARDKEKLASAERSLAPSARGQVYAASVDITDSDAARRWVDDVAARFGALHIVVVNGTSPRSGAAADFDLDEYREAFDKVFFPAVGLARAAVPHLKAAGWGRLLFNTSETVRIPIAGLALSGITRVAIVRLAQELAADLGRFGITVNVLAPGGTRTPLMEQVAARVSNGGDIEETLRAMGEHNVVGRLASPEEVAAVAAFLASERASFVTGTVQLVDAGANVIGHQSYNLTGAGKKALT